VGAVDEVVGGQIQPVGTRVWAPTTMLWIGALLVWIAGALGLIFLGAVLVMLFPGLLSGAAVTAAQRPGRSILIGLALFFGIPILIVLLMATVIGMPLAMVTGALYVAALAAALTAVGLWLGQKLTDTARRPYDEISTKRRIGAAVLGILLLAVIAALPIVGALVVFIALVLGLGALASPAWMRLHPV
jgi:hypothetical protein